MKEFIQKTTEQLETLQQRMNTLREEWLKPLSSIVNQINSNFSSYFSAMNCAGEVILYQPENNVRYCKIEIEMSR